MSKPTLNTINLRDLRLALREFNFSEVMNILGWNRASGSRTITVNGEAFRLNPIAQLGGVQVIEVTGGANPEELPVEAVRRKVSDEVLKTVREHVLIFVDRNRNQSHWYWVKRELQGDNKRKALPRTHTYIKGQPDDLFVSKLSGLFVDLGELNDDGDLSVTKAAQLLSAALDNEGVVKKFYSEFKQVREVFASQIGGISDERDRAWYASVILNRLMFVYFLQGKGFLGTPAANQDTDYQYLSHKLEDSQKRGENRYYSEFLHALFFDAFASPEDQRSPETVAMVGRIPYLNGGLFLKHGIELKYDTITIPDQAFEMVLKLFASYTWNLSDQDKDAGGLDPDVLGHIFEKYINQKGFGAFYTRTEITEYLCEQTIHKVVLDRIKGFQSGKKHLYSNLADAITRADVDVVRYLLTDEKGLKSVSLLDPACGSGAFLVAALKTMLDIYSTLMARIHVFHDASLLEWEKKLKGNHQSYHYNLKKKIITENIFGVDLMEEAAEIAKLRLFLSLVSSANTLDDLEPLPNIDFNILAGNSLIGLLEVDEKEYNAQGSKGRAPAMIPLLGVDPESYGEIVRERQQLLQEFRAAQRVDRKNLTELREHIQTQKDTAYQTLNVLLHHEFYGLKIRFEEATWDTKAEKEGKPIKRALNIDDITKLKPFHWAFEFAEVMERGGFDAIIANPPWDVVKPNGREFLESYSKSISKNNMTFQDFEAEKTKLMLDPKVRAEWLDYLSSFPHVSAYFREAPQFKHQSSIVNGKKTGSDLNLYKLFLELGYRLLREGGTCGIIIPTGIYTDLGATGLRELLFDKTQVGALYALSNERYLFEGVDHRFKFAILNFTKGGKTSQFQAAFRFDPRVAIRKEQLRDFLHDVNEHVTISTDLVRRLSPGSLGVMEFKSALDPQIMEKLLQFPLAGDTLDDGWDLKLGSEFHMTDANKAGLFQSDPLPRTLPLFEGKMIHQFTSQFAPPRVWVLEQEGRQYLLKKNERDTGQTMSYQKYRMGFRDVASSTNERTLIATVLPKNVFLGNTINYTDSLQGEKLLFLVGVVNSFVADWVIRQKVSNHVNLFYFYQLPLPRLDPIHSAFKPIVTIAAQLICVTEEFDELAQEVGLLQEDRDPDGPERMLLRAELDARVALLYGLNETELNHILNTFPQSSQEEKVKVLNAFRRLEREGSHG